MVGMLIKLNQVFNVIERALSGIVIAILAVMALLISSQVMVRYAIGIPLYWSEELARHLMIWLLFLAAVVALRRGAHLSIDLLSSIASPLVNLLLRLAVLVILASFFLMMTWYGWELAQRTMVQRAGALHYPMGYVYGALPVSGFLMFLVTLEQLVKTVATNRAQPATAKG